MNATERGIREQFSLWNKVDMRDVHPDPEAVTVVVGCGTSAHIADSIAASLNAHGVFSRAVAGNEWTRRPQDYVPFRIRPNILALSRSGESTETVDAAIESRRKGLSVALLLCAHDVATLGQFISIRIYGGTLTGLLILSAGLSLMQVVVKPLVSLLDPSDRAAQRIATMGGMQQIRRHSGPDRTRNRRHG